MLNFLIDRLSAGSVLAASLLAYLVFFFIRDYIRDRQITALGGRAPIAKYRIPLAIDFVYRGVTRNLQCKALDFWRSIFEDAGGAAHGNYTAEITLLGSFRTMFTADPENIKALLTAQFSDYGKGEYFHEEWKAFLGDSIFNTDHEKWSASRQLLRPMFARERVGDLETFETHLKKLIPMLGSGDGRPLELSTLFFRYTLDSATDFILGKAMDSLENKDNEFAIVFGEVQHTQSVLTRAGPFKFVIPRRRFKRNLKRLNEIITPYINDVLDMSKAELEQKLAKSDTFLHALARFTRDPQVIRDQLVAVLLAGRDTTAATLSWAFLELARNPRVVEKLRKEIIDHVGPNGNPPSYSDVKEMKYLTAIINETLRLYPAVPFNVRTSLTNTTLPRGGGPDGMSPIGIRERTAVGYSTLLMQRRADLYPPISPSFPYHPSEWVPERWATWTPKSWQYIPFNGGPRICIGQQFAMVEMAYTICRIMQNFDSITDLGNTTTMRTDIIITPADGVKVAFWKKEMEKQTA